MFVFRGFVFLEVLCVCGSDVFVVVVCPPQRDLGLFLMSFESPCESLPQLYLT